MNTFAHIIHPIDPKRDIARKPPFHIFGCLPESWIDFFCLFFPPISVSEIIGIESAAGTEAEGWLVACPLTPRRMLQVKVETAYRKIVQASRKAKNLGARITGLGAFTSVVGDAGLTVANRLEHEIAVTTGNSYVVAMAMQSIREAAQKMEIDLRTAKAAVLGATGSIGKACARLLAEEVSSLILVGRKEDKLRELATEMEKKSYSYQIQISTAIAAIRQANVIISATSSSIPIITSKHLSPGAVICDIAQPRDVSRDVADVRDDVLVIEGDKVEVPGDISFKPPFSFGFPPNLSYTCMAEVIILALEGRYENYTLGREIHLEKVREIEQLGQKHGFKLGGFYSFGKPVTDEEIEQIKDNARKHR